MLCVVEKVIGVGCGVNWIDILYFVLIFGADIGKCSATDSSEFDAFLKFCLIGYVMFVFCVVLYLLLSVFEVVMLCLVGCV